MSHSLTRIFAGLLMLLLISSVSAQPHDVQSDQDPHLSVPITVWIDPFDGPNLASGWMWMRPDMMNWSLNENPGRLRIRTQAQTLYFGPPNNPNNQENILLRPAPSGNFTITTQVLFTPTHNFHQAALLVYRNDDNFILINRGYCSTCTTQGHGVYFDSEQDGVPTLLGAHVYTPTAVYLRIARNSSTYTASYRSAQGDWTVLGQVDRPNLANALIGLSATNAITEPFVPSRNADYDFFQLETQAWSAYLPLITHSDPGLIPLIVDDDGSPDGVIALLYFLQHPGVSIKAITISNGEAHPDIFVWNIMKMMALLERTGIPVAAGRGSPLQGNNAFPEPWRQASDNFWGISLPPPIETPQPVSASQLIVQVVRQSPQPVTVFVSGPHTNLAEALRIDPTIRNRIRLVQSMGGSAYVAGNIHSSWPPINNTVAEWNIWVDPVAASEVITAGLWLRLVPLDATDQVLWTEEDARAWELSGTGEGILAAELLRWMIINQPEGRTYVWDADAAVDGTDPGLCWTDRLHLDIITEPGNQQGRTVPSTVQPENATVCLIPRGDQIRARMATILGRP